MALALPSGIDAYQEVPKIVSCIQLILECYGLGTEGSRSVEDFVGQPTSL